MTGEGAFAGEVCVVTGAGGGIGRATALAFARAGARLALLDRDRDSAETSRVAAAALGAEAIALACDVADEQSVAAAAAEVAQRLGPARVLLNNAGILRAGPLTTLAPALWSELIAVNLTGYLLCTQAFGQPMLAAGSGSIVHIASIGGTHPTPHAGAYSVAKAGVVMLSRQLALEWSGRGVRSNSVSPGLILTPMTEAFYAAPGVAERRRAIVPAGRIGTPEDVARAVLFLASRQADYITGQDLTVDGGLSQALMGLLPRPGFDAASP